MLLNLVCKLRLKVLYDTARVYCCTVRWEMWLFRWSWGVGNWRVSIDITNIEDLHILGVVINSSN